MNKPLILIALLALSGCITLPDILSPKLDLPPAQTAQNVPVKIAPDWWKAYGDPVLDQLMVEALARNDDLRLAAARIEEARSNLGLADGARYPTAQIGGGASRTRSTEVGSFPVPNAINNKFQLGLQAAYETDWWGRYRSASKAAQADLLASEYARDVLQTSLTSAVAQSYFGLCALDAQQALAEDTLANRRKAMALQKLRLDVGDISEYEYRAAQAEVAGTESVLAQLVRQVRLQESALTALLGWQPRQIVNDSVERGQRLNLLAVPPMVPAGIPSDLLNRRPDIQQADQALAGAQSRIAEAKAAIFPSLSLTANLGSESKELSDLFSGPATVWGLAASLAQTIYNSGRTEAAVRGAVARQEQALINYEQTVKNAFRETLDALVTLRQSREQAEADSRRTDALKHALELAQLRYDNGVTSYLEVLDAQRGLFDAQQNHINSRRAQLAALADLNRALGGGWSPHAEEYR